MNENQVKWALMSNSMDDGATLARIAIDAAGPQKQGLWHLTSIQMSIAIGLIYARWVVARGDDAPE